MANIFMTGTSCANGEIIEFIGNDSGVELNDIFQLSTGLCIEITSTGETTTLPITQNLLLEFETCDECLAPYSANTGGNMGKICVLDCSGNTVSITPPHPVWTDGQNHSVVQINAVTLGGNGYYA